MTKFVVRYAPVLSEGETVEVALGLRINIIANISDDGVYCYYPLSINEPSPDDTIFETDDINELNNWKYQNGWETSINDQ